MSMASFRLFAGTDVGLRDNNEDNFTVCADLTQGEWKVPANQQADIPLGNRGCLMVVADGMGGMNAGEVASDIAVKTVQRMFSPAKMPNDVTRSPNSIKAYIKKVIAEADRQVKKHCKKDPSTEGMGSTIVMVWLVGNKVYVGWMGDSRAYSFIPEKGITRLSKDHSYVQELVDAKMITEEEAMFHPQSNVIMRSLGDVTQKAKPDVISHPVVKGEIILLCSDGLCGVCTDKAIAEIISKTSDDLRSCKEALTQAALESDGSDNITIALMQIMDAPLRMTGGDWTPDDVFKQGLWSRCRNGLFIIFALFLLVSLIFAGYKSCGSTPSQESIQDSTINKDMVHTQAAEEDTTTKDTVISKSASDKAKLHNGRTHVLKEKTAKSSTASAVSSDVATNPESELNESNIAEQVKAVKDTTKLKHKLQ